MSRTSAIRDAWRPQTRQDREAILQELQQVLASAHFSNSKRYPALLQYIVEKTLAGESELLKERTLGVEVFDRPPDYDTNADTVVRYTAGEVRKRLSLYYHELDRKPAIQISLPPGSYVPEFLHSQEDAGEREELVVHKGAPVHTTVHLEPVDFAVGAVARADHSAIKRRWWIGVASVVILAAFAGSAWKYRAIHPRTPLDDFWSPLLRNQRTVLICTGGVVFNQSAFSGVTTAGKDVEYPFISFQSASAIALLSGLVSTSGVKTQLESSATTPLTALRDQPVILLGGYNNEWTLRLLDPLPLHFGPEADASILDRTQPQVRWTRDRSLPYSGADDYGLIARFRDGKTDQWVVVVAGVGRNGTEAAADFVTSPHYMQLLRDRLGSDFASRNVEAVLKINVIDGKTGAPSILAVQAW